MAQEQEPDTSSDYNEAQQKWEFPCAYQSASLLRSALAEGLAKRTFNVDGRWVQPPNRLCRGDGPFMAVEWRDIEHEPCGCDVRRWMGRECRRVDNIIRNEQNMLETSREEQVLLFGTSFPLIVKVRTCL